jgi:tRNA nucleotidyltransferase (CCA-adding enzyme)
MKEYLKKLPKEILNLIYAATDIACLDDMRAYLVGGFVRDLLLGVKNFDLDIVVEGNGIKFAEDFARHLQAKLVRHRRFGTATIIPINRLKIDISSSRKEFYPQPAHLPVVSTGTLKDDLFRRDFTINAMAIDISCDNFGEFIDYFGGKADLRAKKIRILHDLSFMDDPTRILRAIRFEQRYNFKIEPATLRTLKEAAKLKVLEKVEPQRIRDDLILMLKEKRPLKEIKRLQELAGLSFISPDLSLSSKDYKLMGSIEKEINRFSSVHHRHRPLDTWLIYLMALLESLNINTVRKIFRKFRFKKGEEKRILIYKKINRGCILELKKRKIKPSRIFAILESLSYEAILLLKAKYKNQRMKKYIEDFFKDYHGTRIYTSGDDLKSLGFEPGPNYQKIFKKILNAKLNGLIRTRKEERSFIKRLIK